MSFKAIQRNYGVLGGEHLVSEALDVGKKKQKSKEMHSILNPLGIQIWLVL